MRRARRRSGVPAEQSVRVDEALSAYLSDQGFEQARSLAAVVGCWEEVVGDQVAAHATPRSLRDGVLTVELDHPAWATEVRFLSEHILGGLAERLGGPIASRLNAHVRTSVRLD